MGKEKVKGSCLCKKVSYQISGNLGIFQYCHCSRCRKFTGSAHAANIFVSAKQFEWIEGESLVKRYEPEDTKYFATAFCENCGSSLPWLAKNKRTVIIPAGTLDGHPNIEPSQNVFCASRAEWYKHAGELPEHDELPANK